MTRGRVRTKALAGHAPRHRYPLERRRDLRFLSTPVRPAMIVVEGFLCGQP